jgi:3D (Asp-Asp-Asp) domain-containing protein
MARRKLSLAGACFNSYWNARQMAKLLRLILIPVMGLCLASCATKNPPLASTATRGRIQTVRTTAYTHTEGSGSRNAIGQRLSGGRLKSASADWSRFPLGTRFRVVSTGDEYIIDDYGGALVGTNTIDLYKTSRGDMHRWGVRHEDIEIIHWGSDEESLKVLRQRRNIGRVRRMIASLEKKQPPIAAASTKRRL